MYIILRTHGAIYREKNDEFIILLWLANCRPTRPAGNKPTQIICPYAGYHAVVKCLFLVFESLAFPKI